MKKIYAFLAIFTFLAFAGTAFAARPVVNLHPASNITSSSATLSLSYTSPLPVSSIIFEYSTDASFGSNTNMITGTSSSVSLTNLSVNTTYYYRASVTNSDGPTIAPVSGSYTFKTLTVASSGYVDTLGETNATVSSMTLNGRVNTYGSNGTYYFRYYNSGCANLIGTTATNNLLSISGIQNVSAIISGLSANTTYCAELVAVINGQTYNGGKVLVKTLSTTSPSSNTCTINSFYADNTSVSYGNSTVLRWSTSNCNSASLSNVGSVGVNDTRNTGAIYAGTSYSLTAYGANNTDVRSLVINVLNNNSNNTYPACYYNNTCYWNGYNWIYFNNNNNTYPNTNYPSCYYTAQCYWSGTTWIYNNGGNVNGNYTPYTYNPHTPYTGGPNYVYRTTPGTVNTVYVDQVIDTVKNTNNYDQEILSRYYPNYDYNDTRNQTNRSLFTGSAGSAGQITLLGLLVTLIIISGIVYFVRSSQDKELR